MTSAVSGLADPDHARAERLCATRKGLAPSKRLAGWEPRAIAEIAD